MEQTEIPQELPLIKKKGNKVGGSQTGRPGEEAEGNELLPEPTVI